MNSLLHLLTCDFGFFTFHYHISGEVQKKVPGCNQRRYAGDGCGRKTLRAEVSGGLWLALETPNRD